MEYNIGDRIKDNKRDITITDKKYFTQANRRSWYYKYHCNICGYNCEGGYRGGVFKKAAWLSKQQLETYRTGCSCCINRTIVPNINSIYVTHNHLSRYFINDDDKKYSIYSNQKVDMKCPFCHTVKQDVAISSLYRQGFSCPICSDKKSIGERIVYYILKYSGMKFYKEFMFDNKKWRYDFYIPKYNAIIEIHGEQHYHQTVFGNLESNQENDNQKKKFALKNGIQKYIVIDAKISNFDYIKNSILTSDFWSIYNLNFVDWFEVREHLFSKSIVKDVCDYWNLHENVTYVDMENIFHLSESTIRKYLNIGYNLGWCFKTDTHFFNKKKDNIKDTYVRKYPLLDMSIDCRNSASPLLYVPKNIYFKSVRLCSTELQNIIGKKIPQSTIRYKLKRNHNDFRSITQREFNEAFYNNECCYGTPFDKNIL